MFICEWLKLVELIYRVAKSVFPKFKCFFPNLPKNFCLKVGFRYPWQHSFPCQSNHTFEAIVLSSENEGGNKTEEEKVIARWYCYHLAIVMIYICASTECGNRKFQIFRFSNLFKYSYQKRKNIQARVSCLGVLVLGLIYRKVSDEYQIFPKTVQTVYTACAIFRRTQIIQSLGLFCQQFT